MSVLERAPTFLYAYFYGPPASLPSMVTDMNNIPFFKAFSSIVFMVIYVIPFIAMVFMNGSLLMKIREGAKQRRAMLGIKTIASPSDSGKSTVIPKPSKATVSLTAVSVTYLILVVPVGTFDILLSSTGVGASENSARSAMFLINLVFSVNNSINFFIYAFDPKFRQRVATLFGFGVTCNQSGNDSTSSTNQQRSTGSSTD